jgi:hypothetical protein
MTRPVDKGGSPEIQRDSHAFGPWWACACDQAIPDHQDEFFAEGSCAFEFRRCGCGETEERHVASVPDVSGGVSDTPARSEM